MTRLRRLSNIESSGNSNLRMVSGVDPGQARAAEDYPLPVCIITIALDG